MAECEVCGNEILTGETVCRFCGTSQANPAAGSNAKIFTHRTVNLEKGMPYVEPALNHLIAVIEEAKNRQITALTVIHGYGSSGRGGKIRKECQKLLDHLCSRGELHCYVPGEMFHKKNGMVKQLLRRYPQLQLNSNLGKANRGITLVIV